ncbi:hypothetical protein FACS1894208_03460 [Clostridia bacterium]|nr:hypothetical protein FACS1894208_03460 [Clostridia bacterium]
MMTSVFLRRVVLLILVSVLLSGILSAGIYIVVTQKVYANMRADELLPIARTVADMLADSHNETYGPFFDRDNKNFLGASMHIYDADGKTAMNPPKHPDDRGKPPMGEDMVAEADLKTVLAGSEISGIRKSPGGQSYLVVGVPVRNGGAVIFTKAMSELNDTLSGLNLTLVFSTLIAFAVMLIPAYFATRHLVVPIRRIQSVALAMARGDFSVRADEKQSGEIGELGRAMNHFAAESERLEQTRRDYVANVSHELRTPIASIRAMGETLRDGMAKTQEKKELFYNNIVRESLRLSRLVDDLLELSHLQSGTEAIQKSPFDLREVLSNVADMYSHLAAQADVKFTVEAESRIAVTSNPDRVEQVLVILMDNALKHTPENGEIILSVTEVKGKTEVSLSNTGEGIPPEDLPYIFDRFYKVDKSHSGGGTGLGLSIANEIIKGLGETIRVTSADEKTAFVFTI